MRPLSIKRHSKYSDIEFVLNWHNVLYFIWIYINLKIQAYSGIKFNIQNRKFDCVCVMLMINKRNLIRLRKDTYVDKSELDILENLFKKTFKDKVITTVVCRVLDY